jgi:CRP/FNR family transcriptional regulator
MVGVSFLARPGGDLHELGLTQAGWLRAPQIWRRSIKRGDVLFAAGELPTSLYEVHAGCFKTCVPSRSGREQVSGFQIIGDLMGLDGMGSECHDSECVALEHSQVNVIPFALLSQLSRESPDFQHRFHVVMGREGERGRQMIFLLGSMCAMERVATFLLDLLERLNARGHSSTAVNLCMSREEIGSYLGLTLETVSRMFSRLKQSGTMEVTNRAIQILDATALRRAAGGLGQAMRAPRLPNEKPIDLQGTHARSLCDHQQ